MELSELKFVVDTSELDAAAKKIAELGTAVSKINKPLQEMSKESAKSNKELVKAEQSAAKAAASQEKLKIAQEKANEATGKSTTMLERQNLILEFMAQGNSKGQSSILATAKAAGALDADMLSLNATLKTQRALIGGDPFDKSIGLMQKLKNEFKTSTEVSSLFNKNLGLTEKQMVDLSREKERLITLYGIEGKDVKGLTADYDALIQKSVSINQANNTRTNEMKSQIKVQEDTAKASAYMATELDRVNRLTSSGGNITTATNSKIIKFEKALKLSGKTAEQQVVSLERYKRSLQSIQKAGGDRQVDYLSRALGPQITDVFVGLYSGQSPMTVLVQQGGQLRDQFALAGVAGADMGKMLTKAAASMISSVQDVGLAIGQVFVNAVLGSGKAVVAFAMKVTGTAQVVEYLRYQLALLAGSSGMAMKAFLAIGAVLTAVVGVAVFALGAGLVGLVASISKVIKEENELNKALNLTGAAMGVSLNMAYASAKSMNDLGVSTGVALSVMTEMSKIGGMTSDSLAMIATTAQALQTAFDIPIEETIKKFKELQEKPTESLTKLAIGLGTIPLEILKQVDAYEKAGDSVKAIALATTSYENAAKEASLRTVDSFGTLTRLGISLKEVWNETWETIMGVGRQVPLQDQLDDAITAAARISLQQSANNLRGSGQRLGKAESVVRDLEAQIKAEKDLAAERQKNALAAIQFEKDAKDRKTAANKAQSDANKIEDSYQRMIEQATALLLSQAGAVENLTKSEIALSKVQSTEDFQKQSSTRQENINKIYEQANATELLKRTEDERKRDVDLIAGLYGKSSNMGDQYYATIEKLDTALLSGNVSLKEYAELLNVVYKTSSSFKALESAGSSVGKNISDINAAREGIASQYGMDFKSDDEKASITSLSKFKSDSLKADVEMEKRISDARKVMNVADFEQAKILYTTENQLQKDFLEERLAREQDTLTDAFKRNQAYSDAFENLFKGMGDSIVDFALTGKSSFSDMVESMLIGLLKLEVQMQMTNALKASGGASGIMSSIGAMFGFANGGSFSGGGIQQFAKGGSFSNSVVDSPTLFKFAKGTGMMGEAGPEAIMPLRRGSDGSLGVVASGGSTGNVSVNVVNNSTSQARTTETTDSKGNRRIEVLIGDMTAGEISRSGSASQKSIKSTFGLQPQLIRR
jgi:phage-related minor tail protein